MAGVAATLQLSYPQQPGGGGSNISQHLLSVLASSNLTSAFGGPAFLSAYGVTGVQLLVNGSSSLSKATATSKIAAAASTPQQAAAASLGFSASPDGTAATAPSATPAEPSPSTVANSPSPAAGGFSVTTVVAATVASVAGLALVSVGVVVAVKRITAAKGRHQVAPLEHHAGQRLSTSGGQP